MIPQCENLGKVLSGAGLCTMMKASYSSPFGVVAQRVQDLVLEFVFDQGVKIIAGDFPRGGKPSHRPAEERIRRRVLHVAGLWTGDKAGWIWPDHAGRRKESGRGDVLLPRHGKRVWQGVPNARIAGKDLRWRSIQLPLQRIQVDLLA
jgi:hypothetical protein